MKISKRDTAGFLLLFSILVGNGFFLSHNAFRAFNFYDMGSFLDASWRVYRGQRPYLDFIYTTGPIHLYMNAFFFLLFGFGKTAVLAHLMTVHSIVIAVVFLMMRNLVPLPISLLTALLTTTSFYWPISHPWYDQSAHFWGILGVGLLTHSLCRKNSQNPFIAGALCGLLVVLSWMTKSNIGAAYGFVFFIVFLITEENKKYILGYAAGISVMALVMVTVISPSRYIEQVFLTYGKQAMNRLPQLGSIDVLFKNYYWIAVEIVTINCLFQFRQSRKFLALLVLFLGVVGVGIFSIYTGSMVRPANIPLWGVHMALAFILLYQMRETATFVWRKIFNSVSIVGLTLLTAWLIVVSAHQGKDLAVWRWIGRDPVGTYSLQAKPFRGWRVDPETGKSLDGLVEFFENQVPKNESLLVLSDLQILYPLTGRDSYRGAPFIFSTNTDLVPSPGKQMEEVKSQILTHPPDWIVDLAEDTPMRREIEQVKGLAAFLGLEPFIQSSYQPAGQWGHYVLFKRKAAAS